MDTHFVMTPGKRGLFQYVLAAVIPAVAAAFLIGSRAGALIFVFLFVPLVIPRHHSIVVFDQSLIEKDMRGRFIRKVNLTQITHYHENIFHEIVLRDGDNRILCRIESGMTNFDLFRQWLDNHNITQSKEK